MNNKQEDRFSMFLCVKSVCEKYNNVWINNIPFELSYNLFAEKIPLIEQNSAIQVKNIKGITDDKRNKKGLMGGLALFVANRLESFGRVSGNNELIANVHYTVRDIVRARDTAVVGICDVILERAKFYRTEIVKYDVSDVVISDLEMAINAYNIVLTKPQIGKAELKSATESIGLLMKSASDILRFRLDFDIVVFKKLNGDFYSEYKSARKIISSGKRTMALIVKIKDSEGSPVSRVSAIITRVVNSKRIRGVVNGIVKKTSEGGVFKIYNLKEGNYKMVVSKIGFVELVVDFSVVGGECTRLDLRIEVRR